MGSGYSLIVPMISVIIPYYFGDKTVRNALLSCAAGRDIDAQIILAFDSPEDDASRKVKHWVEERQGRDIPRTVIIQNDANIGPAATRRRALTKADGKYVILCDQDDELTSRRFEVTSLEGFDLVFFEALRICENVIVRERHKHRLKRPQNHAPVLWNQILATRQYPARMGAVTMTRSIAEEALSQMDGGGEEWEFFISAMSLRPRMRFRRDIGLKRHVHGENLSEVRKLERMKVWRERVSRSKIPALLRAVTLARIAMHEHEAK